MPDNTTPIKILDNGVQQGERCTSLRCKGMYTNWGQPDGEKVAGDGNFWCAKTQRIYGPDDSLVGDGECRHTGRTCYES